MKDLEKLQRLQADFSNYRKRVEKERAEFVKYANTDLIGELSDVLDVFELGLQDDHTKDVSPSFVDGMQGVLRKLKDLLQRRGLERIPTVGEPFNPEMHEAAMQEPSTDHEPGIILAEIRPGYRLGERVLRAPLVKVATAATENTEEKIKTKGG